MYGHASEKHKSTLRKWKLFPVIFLNKTWSCKFPLNILFNSSSTSWLQLSLKSWFSALKYSGALPSHPFSDIHSYWLHLFHSHQVHDCHCHYNHLLTDNFMILFVIYFMILISTFFSHYLQFQCYQFSHTLCNSQSYLFHDVNIH